MRILALTTVDGASGGVDALRYSRYKYGQRAEIESYAAELGRLVVRDGPVFASAPTTVTAPASRAVPIGADLLADGVLRHLNHVRAARSTEPAVRAKLHRYHVPGGDYGAHDLAARRALLATERISSIPALFAGRHVVVVDDLWVTGASAEVTAAAIRRWRPASLTYLVVGRVEPGYAERHPQVEDELNHAAVGDLTDLTGPDPDPSPGRAGPIAVNLRVCKFVLGQPAHRLAGWLDDVAPELAWRLHAAVLAEGLAQTPAYRDGAAVLAAHVERHRLDESAARRGWSPNS